MTIRLADIFLNQRGARLGDYGFEADPAQVERTAEGGFVFYHYTREDRLDQIAAARGLHARLLVVSAEHISELAGRYLIEGLLQPLPASLSNNRYFGDLVLEMMRQYVGSLLLRISVPRDFDGLCVAEMAHNIESKYFDKYGHTALNLGYNLENGREVTRAEANSYVPLSEYRGGYILPNVKATRMGEGIVIPIEYVGVCEVQPLRGGA